MRGKVTFWGTEGTVWGSFPRVPSPEVLEGTRDSQGHLGPHQPCSPLAKSWMGGTRGGQNQQKEVSLVPPGRTQRAGAGPHPDSLRGGGPPSPRRKKKIEKKKKKENPPPTICDSCEKQQRGWGLQCWGAAAPQLMEPQNFVDSFLGWNSGPTPLPKVTFPSRSRAENTPPNFPCWGVLCCLPAGCAAPFPHFLGGPPSTVLLR